MAAMIISVGFSVDIPAHVSYHYYQVESREMFDSKRSKRVIFQASIQEGPLSTPSDRLTNCLSSVAFPAVQAALSTMLCVSSLLFVNLYMAEVHFFDPTQILTLIFLQVFVKTMVLCVVLCNLHGLVFLPAILILLDSIRWACRPKGAAAQRPRPNAAAKPSSGERRKQRVSAKVTCLLKYGISLRGSYFRFNPKRVQSPTDPKSDEVAQFFLAIFEIT